MTQRRIVRRNVLYHDLDTPTTMTRDGVQWKITNVHFSNMYDGIYCDLERWVDVKLEPGLYRYERRGAIWFRYLYVYVKPDGEMLVTVSHLTEGVVLSWRSPNDPRIGQEWYNSRTGDPVRITNYQWDGGTMKLGATPTPTLDDVLHGTCEPGSYEVPVPATCNKYTATFYIGSHRHTVAVNPGLTPAQARRRAGLYSTSLDGVPKFKSDGKVLNKFVYTDITRHGAQLFTIEERSCDVVSQVYPVPGTIFPAPSLFINGSQLYYVA